MKDLYKTLQSIMTEVTSRQAHIQEVAISLHSSGRLTVHTMWSDGFQTKMQLTEDQAKAPDAEFFIKGNLRKERRENEGANL